MLAEEEAALEEEEEEEEEEEDAGRARAARKTRQQQVQAGKTGVGASAAGAGLFIDTRHEKGGREREKLCARGDIYNPAVLFIPVGPLTKLCAGCSAMTRALRSRKESVRRCVFLLSKRT